MTTAQGATGLQLSPLDHFFIALNSLLTVRPPSSVVRQMQSAAAEEQDRRRRLLQEEQLANLELQAKQQALQQSLEDARRREIEWQRVMNEQLYHRFGGDLNRARQFIGELGKAGLVDPDRFVFATDPVTGQWAKPVTPVELERRQVKDLLVGAGLQEGDAEKAANAYVLGDRRTTRLLADIPPERLTGQIRSVATALEEVGIAPDLAKQTAASFVLGASVEPATARSQEPELSTLLKIVDLAAKMSAVPDLLGVRYDVGKLKANTKAILDALRELQPVQVGEPEKAGSAEKPRAAVSPTQEPREIPKVSVTFGGSPQADQYFDQFFANPISGRPDALLTAGIGAVPKQAAGKARAERLKRIAQEAGLSVDDLDPRDLFEKSIANQLAAGEMTEEEYVRFLKLHRADPGRDLWWNMNITPQEAQMELQRIMARERSPNLTPEERAMLAKRKQLLLRIYNAAR